MISIAIPTYNEAAVIEQTLRRASQSLGSSGEPFELIVVDDSSTDGTAELAEALAPELPVRVLRRPGRLGLATAVVDAGRLAGGNAGPCWREDPLGASLARTSLFRSPVVRDCRSGPSTRPASRPKIVRLGRLGPRFRKGLGPGAAGKPSSGWPLRCGSFVC